MLFPNAPSLIVGLLRASPAGGQLLGSAFFVGKNLLATAAHVTDGHDNQLNAILPRTQQLNDYQDTGDEKVTAIPAKIVAIDPVVDIALLRITVDANPFFTCGSADDGSVGDEVSCYGFPHMDQGRFVLTHFRSAIGARILVPSPGAKAKQLVINSQARNGQSGGPVVSKVGKVIALVLGSFSPGQGGISIGGINPMTLHQTTHAVSAEYIGPMIQGA